MPAQIPAYLMRHAMEKGEAAVESLREWALSSSDVGLMLNVEPRTVQNWARLGRHGVKLPFQAMQVGPKRIRQLSFRLQDVETFAWHFDWELAYETLPAFLQERYRVGKFAVPASAADGSSSPASVTPWSGS